LGRGSTEEIRAVSRGLVRTRVGDRNIFNDITLPKIKPSEMTRLPKGIPKPLVQGLERIRTLLNDPVATQHGIELLEREVMYRSQLTGESAEAALDHVLSAWESKAGFKPVIDLKPRTLTGAEWNAMLRDGALFRDKVFHNRAHGEQTHRIQWNVIIRQAAIHPESSAVYRPRPSSDSWGAKKQTCSLGRAQA
jgi:hypothetical protein